mgnify:CR=1 FL=1
MIIHWKFNHFVVLEKIKGKKYWINDPANGRQVLEEREVDECFTGVVLTFEPDETFKPSGKAPSWIKSLVSYASEIKYGLLLATALGLALVIPGALLPILSIIFIVFGIILLIYGSDLFVDSAINIATQLNIPEAIIGISLVAFGTSLPELVVGILSAIRRKVDFALGNVLGSNIYNVLGVLGVSSFFGNFNVPTVIGSADLLFMLFVTVMILGFMFFLKRIGRTYGSIGLILYVGYIFYIYN